MSHESITSSVYSVLRSRLGALPSRLVQPLKRVFGPRPDGDERDAPGKDEAPPELRSLAEREILSYIRHNSALLDRFQRYDNKVERLSGEGTLSESASNRAARAREEALEGLAKVRQSFVSSQGDGAAGAAFDVELRSLLPGLFKEDPQPS